jgi:serine/threonine-protein kinase
MAITAGTRLGPYEVLSKLGEGGMGEVYRARDTRLNRDIAIKVLPAPFAVDPERVARFEREAQALASLNHPNIAQVHGVIDEPLALVMECVEGEDLAWRIARGPLPIDEALTVARQIAAGLSAAHERGIIHRDLKPANVKVAPDGTVKILDFGLAKAMTRDEPHAADLANSPTFSNLPQMTQMGVILGTAAYMSPEQARGKHVDQRADLWAFGCVLYEMLTGQSPFHGDDDSLATVLARILEREPDYTALPPATPPSIRRLIRRCLEKNPSRRLANAQDAALEIDDAQTDADRVPAAIPQRGAHGRLPWFVVAALALGLAAVSVALWRATRPANVGVMHYDIRLPARGGLALTQWPPIAVSRDGSMVVFTVTSEGGTQLFLRRRNEPGVQAIAGTENGASPVFSPDGRWLLFAAGRDLKKMMIGSGATTIGQLQTSRGATWLEDGSIVYAPDAGTGLLRLPPGGGAARPLTTLNTQKGERSHRWPAALPGGKAVLFIIGLDSSPDDYNNSDVDAVIVATGERRHVLTGASFVQYVSGYLIFMRNGSINAVRFDPDSLTVTGTPVPVVNGVAGDATSGAAAFACANDGTLVYAPGASAANGSLRRLVWADSSGAVEPLNVPAAFYNDTRVSPDGSRVAVIVGPSGSGDVWVYDVARKTFTRLTFEGNAATPIWSQDGRSVIYASIEASAGGRTTFSRKPVDGSREPEKLATVNGRSYLASISPGGDRLTLVKATNTQSRVGDILSVPIHGGAETPLVATAADEYSPSLSPDGHWLAYQSNASGRYEVYVQDLREGGGRWQVSTAGGEEPHWSPDGRELFFRIDDRFMYARVTSRDPFNADTPAKLFDGIFNLRSDTGVSYDVDPKTGKFLMTRPADLAATPSISSLDVVLNWFEDLRSLTR